MARRFSSRRWVEPASHSSSKSSRRSVSGRNHERHSTSGKKSVSDTKPDFDVASLPASFGALFISQFPVWAAHRIDPTSADAPLIVHHRACVVATCRQSIKAGVRVGWTLQRAQSICPTAHARAYDASEIAYAWEGVLSALYELTPRIESIRAGFLYFEPPARNSSQWLSTMAAVAKLVREWGAQSVISSDRATAELGSHLVAPGTIRPIKDPKVFLSRVPSARLADLGLSDHSLERLGWLGFHTAIDLQKLSREQIACQFADPSHPQDASLLWRFVRAATEDADRHPIQSYRLPERRTSRVVFEQPATEPAEWEPALYDVVQQTAEQLCGMSAGVLSLRLATKTTPRTASKLLREPTSSARTLFRFAKELASAAIHPGEEIQSLEIELSQLQASGVQVTLIDAGRYSKGRYSNGKKRVLPPALLRAIENIEARYRGTMGRWMLRDKHAPLPENRYTLVPVGECEQSSKRP